MYAVDINFTMWNVAGGQKQGEEGWEGGPILPSGYVLSHTWQIE